MSFLRFKNIGHRFPVVLRAPPPACAPACAQRAGRYPHADRRLCGEEACLLSFTYPISNLHFRFSNQSSGLIPSYPFPLLTISPAQSALPLPPGRVRPFPLFINKNFVAGSFHPWYIYCMKGRASESHESSVNSKTRSEGRGQKEKKVRAGP